jgi:RNA polymerase-associated protein
VLTLWNTWNCPYCQRVRIVLAEKGLACALREVDLANKPPALFRVNPAGAVPVLEDDLGPPIPESLVIMQYLEERFPSPPLLPDGARARARMRLFVERAGPLGAASRKLVLGGADEREEGERDLRRALEVLERSAPEEGFLAGPFSLADAALAPFVARLPQALRPGPLGFPRLGSWAERVLGRDSVARETAPAPPAGGGRAP